jgi:hypothetical protein
MRREHERESIRWRGDPMMVAGSNPSPICPVRTLGRDGVTFLLAYVYDHPVVPTFWFLLLVFGVSIVLMHAFGFGL